MSKKRFSTFTQRRSKLFQLAPVAMESNVKKFQAGDYEEAGSFLCKNFAPLIKSIAHKRTVYTIYGEDAESIAWEFFFEIINSYRGNNFKKLPGLIKKYINFKFYRLTRNEFNGFCNKEIVGMDETFYISDKKEEGSIENSLTKISLMQEIDKLSLRQQEMIIRYYFFGEKRKEIAQSMNCTEQNITILKNRALALLLKNLK